MYHCTMLDVATIDLADTPQLRALLWTGPARHRMDGREALECYERERQWVRVADMDARERAIFEALVAQYGNGVALV